jgi:urease accessory protein
MQKKLRMIITPMIITPITIITIMTMAADVGMITTTMTTSIMTMNIMAMTMDIITTSMIETTSALPLLVWLSPAFPVGAFAYSHGLEAAVEAGAIHDAATLQLWLEDLIANGSLKVDAVLAATAWRAAMAKDMDALREVNELALALSPSRERYLETSAQGKAFITAIKAAWNCEIISTMSIWEDDIAYPIAVASAAAGHGIGLKTLLPTYLLGFLSNLISAAVRLGPVGQTDGQRVTAAVLTKLQVCAQLAQSSTLEDLGSTALRSDIFSMQHEVQYSRLFRS